ncbi:MAG: 4Fe-4S binding protein [Euryarchaeota archaeon]|nr:4Fe-4S binding protein [Euryarchaeota archaeon]
MSEDPIDALALSIFNDAERLAKRYARMPGVHIFVRNDRCIGCRKCVKEGFCRFGAISVVERKAVVDDRRCKGCMRCTHLCPKNAFMIEMRPPRAVQTALREIDKEVSRHLK